MWHVDLSLAELSELVCFSFDHELLTALVKALGCSSFFSWAPEIVICDVELDLESSVVARSYHPVLEVRSTERVLLVDGFWGCAVVRLTNPDRSRSVFYWPACFHVKGEVSLDSAPDKLLEFRVVFEHPSEVNGGWLCRTAQEVGHHSSGVTTFRHDSLRQPQGGFAGRCRANQLADRFLASPIRARVQLAASRTG